MSGVELKRAGGVAYREAGPDDPGATAVLCIHGYPESSLMWRDLLGPIGESGRRAIAPDLPGYGNTPPIQSATWEHHMAAVEDFRTSLGLDRVVLAVHDWGGLIGLRWACEHPEAIAGLILSNTGFFPDGRWHGMARVLRTEGQGEAALEAMTRDGLADLLRASGDGFDDERVEDYWRAFETDEGRRGQLELYRSGDFGKIAAYDGKLGELGVPTLILWGSEDDFAPVAGAHRFHREIPGSELVLLDGGHFVFEDQPERCAQEVVAFLDRAGL